MSNRDLLHTKQVYWPLYYGGMVELVGFEPTVTCLQGRRLPTWLQPQRALRRILLWTLHGCWRFRGPAGQRAAWGSSKVAALPVSRGARVATPGPLRSALVDRVGLEPTTPCVSSRCSASELPVRCFQKVGPLDSRKQTPLKPHCFSERWGCRSQKQTLSDARLLSEMVGAHGIEPCPSRSSDGRRGT